MRSKICLWTIFLLLLPIVSLAQSRSDSLVRELYVKSGMEKQTEQIPSLLQATFDQSVLKDDQMRKLPRSILSAMRASIPEAFAPERMKAVELAELAEKLPDKDIEVVLKWLESPLGRKSTRLEEEASTAEAQADMQKFAAGLQKSPPTAERLKALRDLDSAGKITDSAVDMAINMQVAIAFGMMATLPSEQQKPLDDVAREVERARPEIEAAVRSEMFIYILYTYRNLTEAEIKRYAEFARSSAGLKFSLAVIAAEKKATNEGALKWGKLIGNAISDSQHNIEA